MICTRTVFLLGCHFVQSGFTPFITTVHFSRRSGSFGKVKNDIFLSLIMLWLWQPTTQQLFSIFAFNSILSLKFDIGFGMLVFTVAKGHVTLANRKCSLENTYLQTCPPLSSHRSLVTSMLSPCGTHSIRSVQWLSRMMCHVEVWFLRVKSRSKANKSYHMYFQDKF